MKFKHLLLLVVMCLTLTACSLNTLTFGLLGKEKSQADPTTAKQTVLAKTEQQTQSGPTPPEPSQTHQVVKDDTLYSIANRYHVDLDRLKEINNIGSDNLISLGQILIIRQTTPVTVTVTPEAPPNQEQTEVPRAPVTTEPTVAEPVTEPASAPLSHHDPLPPETWVWPMDGNVVRQFNPKGIGTNGIRISGHEGQTVHAAQDGIVVYRGRGLNGYGTIVILSHHNGLLSTYGFLSKTHVQEGQHVFKRETIGTVGYASNKKPVLYFEVREKGDPINPMIQIGNLYRF